MGNPEIFLLHDNHSFPLIDQLTIGRTPENTLCVPNQYISREHCRIIRTNEYSLVIEDLNSSNGTFTLTSQGNLEETKKLVFDDLRKVSPDKLLIGKDTEIIFHFPNFQTKNLNSKKNPFHLGLVHEPGVLNSHNMELITKIYPNAGAVMLRRDLENFLIDSLKINPKEKIDLQEMIERAESEWKLPESVVKIMNSIRHLGNMGAHKDNVNQESVFKNMKKMEDLKKSIKLLKND